MLEKRAPKNDEESSNEILKTLDMKSISSRKHERIFANMVPISITKHEMEFWQFENFGNFVINGTSPDGQCSKKNGTPWGPGNEYSFSRGTQIVISTT